MRIGVVIYGSLATVSGGYLYDRQLVQHLRDAGHVVQIISLPWRTYDQHLLHNHRVTLMRRLLVGRYDILLQDELNHPSLYLINEQLRRRTTMPLIAIVHHLRASERHPAGRRARYRRIERRYLRSVDGYIYNSETTREAVEALSGEMKPHIVAYPAADHVRQRPNAATVQQRALSEGPLRLLFVGNVIARKGLHTLLMALAKLPANSWRLTVVGNLDIERTYAAAWQRAAVQVMPAGHITWAGRLPDELLWSEMGHHDLLVTPSSYEGFGIVYLEGMAFGLPAIAATAGAAHEIITDGQNGFLIAPDDVSALAARIRLLQGERRMLAQMSLAALERFETAATWQQSMTTVRRFLEAFPEQKRVSQRIQI